VSDTSIEWATKVWNPTTGCDRVSPGCDHCYAMTMAKRLKGMGSAKYQRDGDPRTSGPGFAATHHSGEVSLPMKWRKPQRIFVNSMSDLFHDDIPDMFISRVWDVMRRCPQHTFMVLTKRHARMRSLLSSAAFQETHHQLGGVGTDGSNGHLEHFRTWPLRNVWLGVSAENQQWADIRIPALLDTPAAVRFASLEPLLGPINLDNCGGYQAVRPDPDPTLTYLDWVIVGGESGHHFRFLDPDWIRELRDECNAASVAFLFKQWGGNTPKANGRELDGRTWDQYPEPVTT
jgi:protein gp37